jgi:hypothetical protein
MKTRSLYILFLVICALGFTACAKKGNKTPILSGARNDRTNGDDNQASNYNTPSSNTTWGDVISDNYDSATFEAQFKALMGATIPAEYIGTISGQEGDSTGVRFWGVVTLQSGRLNPNGGSYGNLSTSSKLRIVIWDSFAGQTDSSGKTIPEYPIFMPKLASGSINGKSADLTFSDSYGSIRLNGTFDSSTFEGTMSFTNSRQADGSAGASGTLGHFRVDTCGFFQC